MQGEGGRDCGLFSTSVHALAGSSAALEGSLVADSAHAAAVSVWDAWVGLQFLLVVWDSGIVGSSLGIVGQEASENLPEVDEFPHDDHVRCLVWVVLFLKTGLVGHGMSGVANLVHRYTSDH